MNAALSPLIGRGAVPRRVRSLRRRRLLRLTLPMLCLAAAIAAAARFGSL
jgi:hypothetical protein